MDAAPQVYLLYHYFHPDDVVSARLFSDLAVELSQRGYAVTAMPSVRSCHSEGESFPKRSAWVGGAIHRVWRPSWKQSSNRGRLGNAFFMLAAWTWRAMWMPRRSAEAVIIGTDPILAVLAAIPWRLFRPRARIVHWCHDVYPHAAVADGLLSPASSLVGKLNWLLGFAYRRCDVIADLGPCMRELLEAARRGKCVPAQQSGSDRAVPHGDDPAGNDGAHFVTVSPWSLVEPERVLEADPAVRRELFGDAQLGLLYSGNLGRAHEFESFLKLARAMHGDSVAFCFSGRGPRMDELKRTIGDADTNIRFAEFADEGQLESRIAAADVHLVSLRDEWTGAVVPSKFFGALAAGRPVLFAGSPKAAIGRWIAEHKTGWLLASENLTQTAAELRQLIADRKERERLNWHCHQVYRNQFSKKLQIAKLEFAISTPKPKSRAVQND